MPEPDRAGMSARLRKLPRQFLLALINATTILVIAAAILALLAIVRIEHFAGNIATTMTEAVLSRIDLPPREVLANVRNLAAEVRALGKSLEEVKARENPVLQSEVTRLKEALILLNGSVDRLGSARSILTDEAIARLGGTIIGVVVKLRNCSSNVGPAGTSSHPDIKRRT